MQEQDTLQAFCAGACVHFAGAAANVSQAKIAVATRLSHMSGVICDELNAQLAAQAAAVVAHSANTAQQLQRQPAEPPALVELCAFVDEVTAAAPSRQGSLAAVKATYQLLSDARVPFSDEASDAFWRALADGPQVEVCTGPRYPAALAGLHAGHVLAPHAAHSSLASRLMRLKSHQHLSALYLGSRDGVMMQAALEAARVATASMRREQMGQLRERLRKLAAHEADLAARVDVFIVEGTFAHLDDHAAAAAQLQKDLQQCVPERALERLCERSGACHLPIAGLQCRSSHAIDNPLRHGCT